MTHDCTTVFLLLVGAMQVVSNFQAIDWMRSEYRRIQERVGLYDY